MVGTPMFVLFCFYFLSAAVSFYVVSRKPYPRILNILHFSLLLAAGVFWQQITEPGFVKMIFFAVGQTVEEILGFGVATYFASFAGGILALILQVLFHLMFGYLIGACLGITRLALFGAPKTKWI